jgi:hypothetical protein
MQGSLQGIFFLIGMKNLATDLWTLLIVGPAGKISHTDTTEEQDPFINLREEFLETTSKASISNELVLAVPICASAQACMDGGKATKSLKKNPPSNQLGLSTHTIQTKANSIKFTHQSLLSPHLSTLLKAIRRGFLKGCPNLITKGVSRYTNPSPATARGHMKQPHQGIQSTTQRQPRAPPSKQQLPNVQGAPINNKSNMDDLFEPWANVGPPEHGLNVIVNENDSSIGNIFCFDAFADKQTGILYNNLTGLFPYMSLEGNVCLFLVIYHYESNAILALPISGFNDNTIFAAYKTQFKFLENKGHKIKLNVMDNQCTKQIKKFLTTNDCNLLLVEPHNHCVNAAEHTIQTFKDQFISVLATTDSKFPLQL